MVRGPWSVATRMCSILRTPRTTDHGLRTMWQIGIDEAGYGPNLGPFVMTLVACRSKASDLWDDMRSGVRRADEAADQRLVVADSKQVYSPARGCAELERTVLAAQPWGQIDLLGIGDD